MISSKLNRSSALSTREKNSSEVGGGDAWEGLVQINVELKVDLDTGRRKISIVNVLKPADETLAHVQVKVRLSLDPHNMFWTNLELLRKCKFVAVVEKAGGRRGEQDK